MLEKIALDIGALMDSKIFAIKTSVMMHPRKFAASITPGEAVWVMSAPWTAKTTNAVKRALASTALKIAKEKSVVHLANTAGVLKIAEETIAEHRVSAITALKIALVKLVLMLVPSVGKNASVIIARKIAKVIVAVNCVREHRARKIAVELRAERNLGVQDLQVIAPERVAVFIA